MSEYRGDVHCPRCGSLTWTVARWGACLSVTCAQCGSRIGEVKEDAEGEGGTSA